MLMFFFKSFIFFKSLFSCTMILTKIMDKIKQKKIFIDFICNCFFAFFFIFQFPLNIFIHCTFSLLVCIQIYCLYCVFIHEKSSKSKKRSIEYYTIKRRFWETKKKPMYFNSCPTIFHIFGFISNLYSIYLAEAVTIADLFHLGLRP